MPRIFIMRNIEAKFVKLQATDAKPLAACAGLFLLLLEAGK